MIRSGRVLNLGLWLAALTLVCWALWQLPYGEMLSGVGRLSAGDWLLWLLVNSIILYLAVRRWHILTLALGTSLPLGYLFRLRQAASTVSFVTPGPQFGGEPLQLYSLHRHCRLPLHRAFAVVGLDRFMETSTNITVLLSGVLLLLGTAIMPVDAWLQVGVILAAVLVFMVVAVALILRHPDWLGLRLHALGRRWRPNGEPGRHEQGWLALVELLRGALSSQRPRLWLALLLALAGWAALLLELVMLMRFLGLTPGVSEVLLIMVGMRLAMLLPMPGGIGTVEASLLWSFGFLSLPLSAAAGLIALMRLRDGLILLLGFACLSHLRRPAGLAAHADATAEESAVRAPAD